MASNDLIFFYSILAFLCLEFLWELYLSIRQHRVYTNVTEIPDTLIGIIKHDTFHKARVYALDKSKFGLFKDCISQVISVALLLLDYLVIFWVVAGNFLKYYGYENADSGSLYGEILQSGVFMFFMNSLSTVTSLPFSIYNTFVLEEKHGFNKQTVPFFIKDKIKVFIVSQVISIPITCAITYIVKIGGEYFFIYLWLFTMFMTFFFLTIYPDFIAPLFDKYTPLPEGELKTMIEKLAASVEFPLYKIYVVEGSKRSVHSNAYFYGFFKNKRIVLFDTLLKDFTPENSSDKKDEEKKGCDNNEVLAVLGHELGHWKMNHLVKNLIIMQVNLFLMFVVFGSLYQYKPMYEAFGFYNQLPVMIGLLIVLQFVFSPYHAVVNFAMTILSRHFEFEADKFAKKLGRSFYLKLALIKLNTDNLSFPIYDPWYSMWHHSHPPLLERLQALEKDN